jgi:hypothetical protein
MALALIAGWLAAARLSHSVEMPGLAAIELVLLALPWSLLLGVPPMSQAGLAAAGALVLAGVLLNARILFGLVATLEDLWRRRSKQS